MPSHWPLLIWIFEGVASDCTKFLIAFDTVCTETLSDVRKRIIVCRFFFLCLSVNCRARLYWIRNFARYVHFSFTVPVLYSLISQYWGTVGPIVRCPILCHVFRAWLVLYCQYSIIVGTTLRETTSILVEKMPTFLQRIARQNGRSVTVFIIGEEIMKLWRLLKIELELLWRLNLHFRRWAYENLRPKGSNPTPTSEGPSSELSIDHITKGFSFRRLWYIDV